MRVSIVEQAKNFILESRKNNKYIYSSEELKLSLKNYLVSSSLLYSPIRGIYILKASSVPWITIINKYKYEIIKKLWGVVSWDFALNYYLWNYKKINEFILINNSKNFISFIWEDKNIKIHYKLSKIPRIVNQVNIEWSELSIESPLSFVINNFIYYKGNKKFESLILKLDINPWEIVNLLLQGFKLSGISQLAIFYKNSKINWKYKLIENELKDAWKKIDRRNNKINIRELLKKEKKNKDNNIEDLNSLLGV